jgi:hypothetical protein
MAVTRDKFLRNLFFLFYFLRSVMDRLLIKDNEFHAFPAPRLRAKSLYRERRSVLFVVFFFCNVVVYLKKPRAPHTLPTNRQSFLPTGERWNDPRAFHANGRIHIIKLKGISDW